MNRLVIFSSFILLSKFLLAQHISGVIIDADTRKPIPFASITHANSNKGVTSDIYGKFQIKAVINDTLIISSIGYHKKIEPIRSNESIMIFLPQQSYYLNEVQVKSKDEIPITYKSVVFPEGDPGIGSAIVQPFSYWYYKLSKKEKEKRKIRSLLEYEKSMAKVMSIYNKDLVAEYTGLQGTALDSCFIYCNLNIDLNEFDDKFTIAFKLLETITDYNKINKAAK